METSKPVGVLFVCLGNICRSPLAEGVFRHRVAEAGLDADFRIDSCGTSGYHVGEPPDPGSVQVAGRRGIDLSDQRSRKLVASDLSSFDYVVCMDASNVRNTRRLGDGPIQQLREDDPQGPGPVPDPWGGGLNGFEEVFAIVDRSCEALLARICDERGL
jgi:protein-tyrosine phosphatase